ncbi:hypothetical protein [Caballeronia zhejiangensis]|uniref:hypothetical protein n=2 Tax=Burkholderiaceae TaxID=119060 RepID=UPI001EF5E40F|nr:hypothetical protein [Caballeronia zhejiangensis]MCG7401835.1 hypothetical protein [Caballeronia zhejiangensis]
MRWFKEARSPGAMLGTDIRCNESSHIAFHAARPERLQQDDAALLAGLERPVGGSISVNGVTVFSARDETFVPPNRRKSGMVFEPLSNLDAKLRDRMRFELRHDRFHDRRRDRARACASIAQNAGPGDHPFFDRSGELHRAGIAERVTRQALLRPDYAA